MVSQDKSASYYSEKAVPIEERLQIKQQVYERHHGICTWCHVQTDKTDIVGDVPGYLYPTMDHLIPAHKGGKYALDNLVLACWLCNNIRARYGM